MPKNLQQLQEKIIKVIPEIMELKFGCNVEIQNYFVSVTIIENRDGWTFVPESGELNNDFVGLCGYIVYFDKKHITKILGRDITLEDVLIAFEKSKHKTFNEKEWDIEHFLAHNVLKIVGEWKLGKPLHLQPEAVVNYLNSIL